MSKHTPGPWTFDGPADNVIVWSGPNHRVCFMTSDGNAKANARLISAAPQLLEVVQLMQGANWKLDDDVGMEIRRRALAAVQKALDPVARDPSPETNTTLDDDSPRYSMRRVRDELAKAKEYARSQALEENAAIVQAGKHLAVKLAEVYRAAGQKPADCQAIRGWMAAIAAQPAPQDHVDGDLLPCPFCGGNNLRFNLSDIEGWVAHVECTDCDDMIGPMSKYKYDDKADAEKDAAEVWNRRAPPPQTNLRWLPIELADKSIDRIYDLPGMPRPIGNSEEYWCRDEDGRVFLAAWADDKKRAYWWDLDGESQVDPVEFMPHPLDPRWSATTEGQTNG